jgi:hypothetical protein
MFDFIESTNSVFVNKFRFGDGSLVQDRLQPVSNEGHFTLEAETVFCPYPSSQCSGVTYICHMALPPNALRAVQVRLKSVSNEVHFTLEPKTIFRPISPRISVGWLKYAKWNSLCMR